MKRIIIGVALLCLTGVLSAQTEQSQADRIKKMEQRYDLLVSKFGPAGVGVETVLDSWAQMDSTDAKMLLGRFNYFFTKSKSTKVVTKPEKKWLGMEPLLSLKDTTGSTVYYYEETVYDDELYGQAVKAIDRAVAIWPDRLDFRFVKANAYIAYEKESPDMALAYLLELASQDVSRNGRWKYDGKNTEKGFFTDAMQEYCYSFYTIGTPAAFEAFKALSEKMLSLNPGDAVFMNNIGTYWLVGRHESKTARKWYDKVLKKHPGDYTAMKNALLIARRAQDVKAEKKYLGMMAQYGPETEKAAAQARLEVLSKKK